MAHLNSHYLKLKAGYLFPEISRRVKAFTDAKPDAARRLIRCGIGDVTEPLPAAARSAMHKAVDELGVRESIRGYGPEQGYEFLRQAIAENDYRARGIEVADDEIFVSDGSKCDCANILDVFGDSNRIRGHGSGLSGLRRYERDGGPHRAGKRGGRLQWPPLFALSPENGFMPDVPDETVDLIYLCSPNNPTGAVATRERLESWVRFALAHEAIILYDAAYEAYIAGPGIPHSIYEIPGARKMRDRVSQLLQERRVHRCTLRVHRGAKGTRVPSLAG